VVLYKLVTSLVLTFSICKVGVMISTPQSCSKEEVTNIQDRFHIKLGDGGGGDPVGEG
jgi:hypothetical protein